MALDIITVSQGHTCIVTQTECCVHTQEAANLASLLNHLRTRVSVLSDPLLCLWRRLEHQWFRSWGFGRKLSLILAIIGIGIWGMCVSVA